jgi:hypothetical protein
VNTMAMAQGVLAPRSKRSHTGQPIRRSGSNQDAWVGQLRTTKPRNRGRSCQRP